MDKYKSYINNKSNFTLLLVFLGVSWVFYALLVSVHGKCGLYLTNENDNWYVKYEVDVSDETGSKYYEETFSGPITKHEALKIIENCQKESNEWHKKYGTVYYLAKGNEYEGILFMIISFGPLVLLYVIGKKQLKNENRKKVSR